LPSFLAASTKAGVIGSATTARACAWTGRTEVTVGETIAPIAADALSTSRLENRILVIVASSPFGRFFSALILRRARAN
jgi:hypothetical protein